MCVCVCAFEHLRLRRVVRRVDVTHVLRTLEDAERQRREEIARRQQTGGRSQREAGVAAQKGAHLAQLRNAILAEDVLRLQLGEDLAVLGARVLRHQVQHRVEDGAPRLVLDVRVVDVRNAVAAALEKMGGKWRKYALVYAPYVEVHFKIKYLFFFFIFF